MPSTFSHHPLGTKSSSGIIKGGLKIQVCENEGLVYLDFKHKNSATDTRSLRPGSPYKRHSVWWKTDHRDTYGIHLYTLYSDIPDKYAHFNQPKLPTITTCHETQCSLRFKTSLSNNSLHFITRYQWHHWYIFSINIPLYILKAPSI